MSFINVLGSVVSSYCRQTGERQWEEGGRGERERGRKEEMREEKRRDARGGTDTDWLSKRLYGIRQTMP